MDKKELRLTFHSLFVLVSLVKIVDFLWPGRIIQDEIIHIKRERQEHYNAARNYHYSYKIITSEHQFPISEDFVALIQEKAKIEYAVSRIFNEVNWYRLLSSEDRDVYSLRILSGLILPLLAIISILLTFLFRKNTSVFVSVLQILLILDLILMMF